MANPGDVIEIPRTGEKVIFRQTTEQTGGELLRMDFYVNPGGFTPRPHIHLDVEERVEVVSGRVQVMVAGKKWEIGPGESALFPMRAPHGFAAVGDEQLHMIVDVLPPREFETVFETVFGLYRDGKTNAHGHEHLLQSVLIARMSRSYAAGPPVALQRALVTVAAPISRLFGFRSRYEKYSGADTTRTPG